MLPAALRKLTIAVILGGLLLYVSPRTAQAARAEPAAELIQPVQYYYRYGYYHRPYYHRPYYGPPGVYVVRPYYRPNYYHRYYRRW